MTARDKRLHNDELAGKVPFAPRQRELPRIAAISASKD
jgi:hypothetical protein